MDIRTDNPILAVKLLNGAPRPILERERERKEERERILTSGISLVCTQSMGLPTYCLVVTSREKPSTAITEYIHLYNHLFIAESARENSSNFWLEPPDYAQLCYIALSVSVSISVHVKYD